MLIALHLAGKCQINGLGTLNGSLGWVWYEASGRSMKEVTKARSIPTGEKPAAKV